MAVALGIDVIALRVQMGRRSGVEGSDISPDDVSAALRRKELVTTSRPTPAEFGVAYERALAAGASGVVSIQLSSSLSGTCDAARMAAAEFGAAVRVIDSRTVAMGLGFAVLAAARVAAERGGLDEVSAAVTDTVGRSSVLFYVDSLEWLRRGGRIGPAAARFGTALAMKPLLRLTDGRIVASEKVRTASKALARILDQACDAAGGAAVDVAVHHLAAGARAADVEQQLRARLPRLGELYVCEVGAVVGAHVGPGLIGIVVCPRPDSALTDPQRLGQ